MNRLRSTLLIAGLAALVLFSALMLVIAVDYNTPGDMTPGTALAVGAGGSLAFAALLFFLFRGGSQNGRA